MMKKLLLAALALALSVPVFAQPPQEKPGPENQALGHFVGTWKLEGKVAPGPMGPGGPFSGSETCRMLEGGFHLVCDSKGTGALGNMTGHMALTWDRHTAKFEKSEDGKQWVTFMEAKSTKQ